MSLPLDKLLDENTNRYELCIAAMKISQRLAATMTSEEIAAENEKLAILSMKKLLNGDIKIKPNDFDKDEVDDQ